MEASSNMFYDVDLRRFAAPCVEYVIARLNLGCTTTDLMHNKDMFERIDYSLEELRLGDILQFDVNSIPPLSHTAHIVENKPITKTVNPPGHYGVFEGNDLYSHITVTPVNNSLIPLYMICYCKLTNSDLGPPIKIIRRK